MRIERYNDLMLDQKMCIDREYTTIRILYQSKIVIILFIVMPIREFDSILQTFSTSETNESTFIAINPILSNGIH
jgi:hypothetical protein